MCLSNAKRSASIPGDSSRPGIEFSKVNNPSGFKNLAKATCRARGQLPETVCDTLRSPVSGTFFHVKDLPLCSCGEQRPPDALPSRSKPTSWALRPLKSESL